MTEALLALAFIILFLGGFLNMEAVDKRRFVLGIVSMFFTIFGVAIFYACWPR